MDDITPNQAISDPKKRQHIMHLNILKARDNGFVTDLKPGDKVRIDDTALFKKGSKSRWSDEIHVVKEATGKTVTLTDGTTHKRSKILIVPHNTPITTEKNVIKVATKQHKDKLYFKREDLDTANIIEGKEQENQTTQHHQLISEVEKLKPYKIQYLRSNKIIFCHEYDIILFHFIV